MDVEGGRCKYIAHESPVRGENFVRHFLELLKREAGMNQMLGKRKGVDEKARDAGKRAYKRTTEC